MYSLSILTNYNIGNTLYSNSLIQVADGSNNGVNLTLLMPVFHSFLPA